MPMNGANLGLNSESGPSMIPDLTRMDCLAAEERVQLGQLAAWCKYSLRLPGCRHDGASRVEA